MLNEQISRQLVSSLEAFTMNHPLNKMRMLRSLKEILFKGALLITTNPQIWIWSLYGSRSIPNDSKAGDTEARRESLSPRFTCTEQLPRAVAKLSRTVMGQGGILRP